MSMIKIIAMFANIEFANIHYICSDKKQIGMVKKNAITRYKILDSLLSNKYRRFTMPDLVNKVNEMLEEMGMDTVTRRCIEKDLNTLECAPYDACIIRERSNGSQYIRYEEEGFSVFTKKLSEDEENLLSEVLNTLGQFDGLENFEWLDGLKNSLNIKERRKIIQFDSNPYLANRNLLGSLFTVISNRQAIILRYHTFRSSEIKEVIVHPYLLKEYNKRWFLLVGAEDGTILTFAIDRINEFVPIPNVKYKEPEDDLEERFDEVVGVTILKDAPINNILLWVSDSQMPYIATKPLHGSQKILKGERAEQLRQQYNFVDGWFVELRCIVNYELLQLLASFMDGVMVLSPSMLRSQIAERIEKLANAYQVAHA